MEDAIEKIIAAVKSKKELCALDDAFVRDRIKKILSGDNRIVEKLRQSRDFAQFTRSQEYKHLLKAVRRELRAVYGVFQEGEREELLVRLQDADTEMKRRSVVIEILKTHTSSRERASFYDPIYGKLASLLPPPKSILDLGCGMNPLSHIFLAKHGWQPRWIAVDIGRKDLDFLEKSFSVLGIEGSTLSLDLTKDYAQLEQLPADVTFLFKLLDSLEESERHISYKIFEHIRSQHIVASFPTKSLGGRRSISKAGRTWFERLLGRLGHSWETFEIADEIFYVIRAGGDIRK